MERGGRGVGWRGGGSYIALSAFFLPIFFVTTDHLAKQRRYQRAGDGATIAQCAGAPFTTALLVHEYKYCHMRLHAERYAAKRY